eukprot:TRINITY_DN7431_c2_g1_i1.p1 TRINITY_DN7431_c2_g1~~TRINITY_DN7431_c2_g1_i1.p1  ORF type:complete len:121 (+),score=11.87 TRINITY_DN7431_c2_g1_i1:1-363(+)
MFMTFYQGVDVVILFNGWSVHSTGPYVGSVVITVLGSFFISLLKDFTIHTTVLPFPFKIVLIFICFAGMYAVMLITMTYNGGLFLAVCFGLTAAWALNEHIMLSRRRASSEDCEQLQRLR